VRLLPALRELGRRQRGTETARLSRDDNTLQWTCMGGGCVIGDLSPAAVRLRMVAGKHHLVCAGLGLL
jgi:hypothetical protein